MVRFLDWFYLLLVALSGLAAVVGAGLLAFWVVSIPLTWLGWDAPNWILPAMASSLLVAVIGALFCIAIGRFAGI